MKIETHRNQSLDAGHTDLYTDALIDSSAGHKKQEEPGWKFRLLGHYVRVASAIRVGDPSWTYLRPSWLEYHSSSVLSAGTSTSGTEKSGFGYAACSGRIGGDGSVSTRPKP